MAYVKKRGDSYFIRCSAGYDSTGKQIQKSMTWRIPEGMSPKKAEKEAHHQAAIFEEQVRNGEVYDGRLKFKDFAEKWFTNYAELHLRPRTVTRYRECMQRINKAVGHVPINKIRPQHLIKFYNSLTDPIIPRTYAPAVDFDNLIATKGFTRSALAKSCGVSEYAVRQLVNGKYIQEKPALKLSEALEIPLQELFNISESEHVLSQETILSHHRIISSIMSKAVKWQIIPSNPAERVEAPKVQKKEAVYLDEYQAVEMLEALENEPLQYKTAIYMLLYTGFRRGEMLGLKWDDINFDNNTIAVKRSVLYNSDMGVFEDETKNATSQRIIKVSTGGFVDTQEILRLSERMAAKSRGFMAK
ncbi:MAG: tyrosine-type recombinase/integrase [Firmicutes bacterium]|nr:tyrosine-type recombinase/integrase [Bacillota bacterium]